MEHKFKISIISPSKNTGRFARETIESILEQTCDSWEHIIVDGKSSDETLDVIGRYPHIRLISEKDNGPDEAFRKGLATAKGKYIMFCGISDGYLDRNWFQKCIDIMDNDQEISLVWGLPQYMTEEGYLNRIAYDHFFNLPPPQKKNFLYYWFKTYFHFPEGNFCVRKQVMDKCFPVINAKNANESNHFLTFNYNFNVNGYLPYFLQMVANYGRIHDDAGGQLQLKNGLMKEWVKKYKISVDLYKKEILNNLNIHHYRDGYGNVLEDVFS